jgi:hypothetical protein
VKFDVRHFHSIYYDVQALEIVLDDQIHERKSSFNYLDGARVVRSVW